MWLLTTPFCCQASVRKIQKHAHKEFFQDLITALFDASRKPFNGSHLASQESQSPELLDLPLNSPEVPSSIEAVPRPYSVTSISETLVPLYGKLPDNLMEKHELVKLFPIAKSCQSCRLACKPRVSLAQQDCRTQAPRLARSYYGCKVCREAICLKKKHCFLEHIERARLAESQKNLVRSESIK